MVDGLTPLRNYFDAVNMDGGKQEKVGAITACFSENCVVRDQFGNEYKGKEGVASFYTSDSSPVFKAGFSASPDSSTVVVSDKAIAVEILLAHKDGKVRVGDWFYLDNAGKITKLNIFAAQQGN